MELGLTGPVERGQRLPWGPQLDRAQRMTLIRLSGKAERLAYGNLKDTPDEAAYEQLLAISRDPLVWGVMLGAVLADIDLQRGSLKAPIVDWARRAGADEDAAEMHRAWRLAQPRAMGPIED